MTTALTLAPALHAVPGLRLVRPAPVSVPPFDDEPGERPALRLVTTPEPEPVVEEDATAWLAATRTPTSELPAPGPVARTLVLGLLEVLAGVRAVKQLRRDTTPELDLELAGRVTRARVRSGSRPEPASVRSLHVQARPEGVVEVCATVLRAGRIGALALRLEGVEGRWRCTDLVGV